MRYGRIMKAALIALAALVLPSVSAPEPRDRDVAREVERHINLARTDPAAYAQRLRAHRAFYDGDVFRDPDGIAIRTQEGVSAVDEAIAFLERQTPLPPLAVSAPLRLAAADHVEDQGPFGAVGHVGSDGSAFTDRIVRHGGPAAGGENIAYGGQTGEAVVIQLIVDDGVPDRGHRTNIFRPGYVSAGAACGRHRAYRYMCVIDFGYAAQPRPR